MNNSADTIDLSMFYHSLIEPEAFEKDKLLANKNQVAGHTGFYLLENEPNYCLKPFNTKCVRGRREHLFYQLMEYYKKNPNNEHQPDSEKTHKATLYYKQFNLLINPSPKNKCNCIIDEALFRLLASYVANFYHVKYLSNPNESMSSSQKHNQLLNSIVSEQVMCPCYGNNPKYKTNCARDYRKEDFLCLEDLTAHCREPCIIDIKVGQITYDPMAIKEKVLEQSSKYRRLREFGFRILGMKLGDEIKDRDYGKTLETSEQVNDALDSFFVPLTENHLKCIVISRILVRLRSLLSWFKTKNINQLKFFSSSLLITYDSFISDKPTSCIQSELASSVRVSMIDFAHVFHVHDSAHLGSGCLLGDENYIFGLIKLEQFFAKLEQRHRTLSV